MSINPQIGWQVIVVISVILGILVSTTQLKAPINSLITEVARLSERMVGLTATLDRVNKDVQDNEEKNCLEHKKMSDDIVKHETRITVLEKERKKF
jgi:hypothetical protein